MSQVYIIYHQDDLDGMASAAIAYKYVLENIVDNNPEDIITIPMSYGKPLPFKVEKGNEDLFIFVDFILQPFEQMLQFNPENLIIIDHHKTTIENLELNPDFKSSGLIGDLDNKKSAAELAWEFFFPQQNIPLFVQYISYYDTWQNDLPGWNDILAFNEGMKIALQEFEEDKGSWLDLITWAMPNNYSEYGLAYASFLSETLRWGRKIYQNKVDAYNKMIKENSFISEFDSYKVLVINANDDLRNFMLDSPTWKDGEFDIAICFNWKQNSYTCHMRTDKKDIDLSEIAKKYKGGGHRGASGFQCKKLPFKFLIKKEKEYSDPLESIGRLNGQ